MIDIILIEISMEAVMIVVVVMMVDVEEESVDVVTTLLTPVTLLI